MATRAVREDIASTFRAGGVGVLPTDTLYGLVGSALDKRVVERIYKLRRRSSKKPMIVLIGSKIDVRLFGVHIDRRTSNMLNDLWPGKVSVILPCGSKKFV